MTGLISGLVMILFAGVTALPAQTTDVSWGKEAVIVSGPLRVGVTMTPRPPRADEPMLRGSKVCAVENPPATCTIFHYRVRNLAPQQMSIESGSCSPDMFELQFLDGKEWTEVPFRERLECSMVVITTPVLDPGEGIEGDMPFDLRRNLDRFLDAGAPPLKWAITLRVCAFDHPDISCDRNGWISITTSSPTFQLVPPPVAAH